MRLRPKRQRTSWPCRESNMPHTHACIGGGTGRVSHAGMRTTGAGWRAPNQTKSGGARADCVTEREVSPPDVRMTASGQNRGPAPQGLCRGRRACEPLYRVLRLARELCTSLQNCDTVVMSLCGPGRKGWGWTEELVLSFSCVRVRVCASAVGVCPGLRGHVSNEGCVADREISHTYNSFVRLRCLSMSS